MLLLGVLISLFTSLATAAPHGTYAIVQGMTTANSAQFSLLLPAGETFEVKATDENSSVLAMTEMVRSGFPGSEWEIVQYEVQGLRPGRDYRLQIFNSQGSELDRRLFSALDTENPSARIAVGSCMNDYLHNARLWREMQSHRPDVIMFTGDVAYLDFVGFRLPRKPDREQIWRRHVETRNTLDLFRWRKLVPVLAIYDDHDFGFNNVVGDWQLAQDTARVFSLFFPQRARGPVYQAGPGASFKANLFGRSWVFLDGRAFRDDQARHTNMFGSFGETFLRSNIDRDQTFLVTGSQFFGAYLRKDSYEHNFPEDFRRFTSLLASLPTRFTFVTGDVHFSEVMAIESEVLGYPTLEITASSLHSITVPGLPYFYDYIRNPNPRRLGAIGTHNFTLLDVNARGRGDLRVRGITWRGTEKFAIEFEHTGLETRSVACEASFQ